MKIMANGDYFEETREMATGNRQQAAGSKQQATGNRQASHEEMLVACTSSPNVIKLSHKKL
jgi:hypothetical protein